MIEQAPPFVSVVIPVLNDPEHLEMCLEALQHQTYPKNRYQIIVVDNGSDESIEPLVSKYSQARSLVEPRRGSYVARNTGILQANGEIIALTDADCIPTRDWIEKGTAALVSVPNCGMVGGQIQFLFKNPDRPTGVELYDRVLYLRQQEYIEKLKFGATANIFTFKKVLEQVGLFNEQLKSVGDREWGERVFKAGYKQIYAHDACILHPARPSLPELLKKATRVARGTYQVNKKRNATIQDFLKHFIRDSKPPLRIFFRIWLDSNIPTSQQKIEYLTAMVLVKYVTAQEKIKLLLADLKKGEFFTLKKKEFKETVKTY